YCASPTDGPIALSSTTTPDDQNTASLTVTYRGEEHGGLPSRLRIFALHLKLASQRLIPPTPASPSLDGLAGLTVSGENLGRILSDHLIIQRPDCLFRCNEQRVFLS